MKTFQILITNIFNLITFKNTNKGLDILNPIKQLDEETIELDFSKIKKINIKNLKMIEFEDNIILKTNKHFVLDSNAFSSNNKTKVLVNPDVEVTKDFDPDKYIDELLLREKEKLLARMKELNESKMLDEFNKPIITDTSIDEFKSAKITKPLIKERIVSNLPKQVVINNSRRESIKRE